MKANILLILIAIACSLVLTDNMNAQCTPNPTYTSVGIHPIPFPQACVGSYYDQVAYFTFPADTTVTVPPFGTYTLPYDSFRIVSVTNMPAGLSYVCGSPSCTFYPAVLGQQTYGCASIIGTPLSATLPGDSVSITITAWLTAPFVGVQMGSQLIKVQMPVVTTYITPQNVAICQGDSIFLQGAWQQTASTYLDTLPSMGSCDSIVVTSLTISTPANAGISSLDSVCSIVNNLQLISLIDGTPDLGGIWIDEDASGALLAGVFDATSVALGVYHFTYIAESLPCPSDSSMLTLLVQDCGIGLTENDIDPAFSVFPNPCKNNFTLELNQRLSNVRMIIYSNNGSVVSEKVIESGMGQVQIPAPKLPGIYLIQLLDADGSQIGSRTLVVE